MGGHIQIIQVTFDSTVFRERLAEIADEFLDGSAENGRVFTLVALENAKGLVHLHDLFNELVDLLFCDVVFDSGFHDRLAVVIVMAVRLFYIVLVARAAALSLSAAGRLRV